VNVTVPEQLAFTASVVVAGVVQLTAVGVPLPAPVQAVPLHGTWSVRVLMVAVELPLFVMVKPQVTDWPTAKLGVPTPQFFTALAPPNALACPEPSNSPSPTASTTSNATSNAVVRIFKKPSIQDLPPRTPSPTAISISQTRDREYRTC
jgi:hypothetical protein